MCGIAGFINFPDNSTLAAQTAKIQQHRGPDDQSNVQQNNLLFCHQRLSIIDLESRANQPFVKDGLTMIFNGEIYNYKELKASLQAANPSLTFSTTSDTEVLLELYRAKKEACLNELIGMFAFAIYEQETGKLFIARDHFGIKPIFYTQINNRFAFSSELKTLTAVPGFQKKINTTALAGALNYLWVPGHQTMFENCFKLPPASYMIIDTRAEVLKPEIKTYWKLDGKASVCNEDEAIALVRKEIEKSVSRHMVADVPVSSFLSGGLDSSLISVLAARSNSRLSTYTIGTSPEDKKIEQMPEDEKYARRLADLNGFDHHEIIISSDIVKALPEMVVTLDEPIGDPAAINTFLICKAAREKGVKVLLSGMGADEIFCGYRRQQATLLAMRYRKLPGLLRKAIRGIVNILPVKLAGKGLKLSRWAKRYLSFADLPTEEAYMQSYSYYTGSELQQLLKKDCTSEYAALRKQHADLFNRHYQQDPVNQMCFTDISMFMLGLNLTYTDRASMAASVEVRVPFIDKKVVEMAMSVCGDLKYRRNQSKYILKKAAEKYLPHDIIYRPKASFGAPIRSWISKDLKPMVDELLSTENIRRRGLFNPDYVRKLIEDDRSGAADNAYRIYQLLTIELWLRHYADDRAQS